VRGNHNNKYTVDVEEIHKKNIAGANLRELAKEYGIPKTTLGRYLIESGYTIKMNGRNPYKWMTENFDYIFSRNSSNCWKQALVYYHGHECFICGYGKIVEAHHIKPLKEGGATSIRNGILLCPNHHAEFHAKLLDLTEALVKLDEFLESLEEGNQKPRYVSKQIVPSDIEGLTTNPQAKAVTGTRASRSRVGTSKRYGKEEYFKRSSLLRDMI
jgi:hypothetical protein